MDSLALINLNNLRKNFKQNLISTPGFNNKNFLNTLCLADFLESLEIWDYTRNVSLIEKFSFFDNNYASKSNSKFLSFLVSAKNKNLIKDFVGIGKKTKSRIVFSILIDQRPKPYLIMYLLFLKKIKKIFPSFEFIIHLEDWFLKDYSSEKINKKIISRYKQVINKFNVADRVILTESFFRHKIIPPHFIKEVLVNINVGDFLSVLPFQKRNPEFILLGDIFHFIWNIFTIQKIPGIYLTSMNSKREFLVFRKALKGKPPVIFFPSAPEDIFSTDVLLFYSNYLLFPKNKTEIKELKSFLENFKGK